jgi:hypothetical protein
MEVLVLEGWRGEEKGERERHGQKEYGTLGLNRRLGHGLLTGRGDGIGSHNNGAVGEWVSMGRWRQGRK